MNKNKKEEMGQNQHKISKQVLSQFSSKEYKCVNHIYVFNKKNGYYENRKEKDDIIYKFKQYFNGVNSG